jgi:hypothetical protein
LANWQLADAAGEFSLAVKLNHEANCKRYLPRVSLQSAYCHICPKTFSSLAHTHEHDPHTYHTASCDDLPHAGVAALFDETRTV